MEASESTGVSSDLTSTVESLLTNNGHEKKISHNDSISVGDSTPSSSSDANMQASVVKAIQDDPISSTSDSLIHEAEINLITLTPDINFIVGVEGSGSTPELVTETDFFTSELNIESMSSEKISEDVEDIANDLENLLGETTSSYNVICSNSDIVTEVEVEKKVNVVGIENVENIVDKDADLNISVKPDIHDVNVQSDICLDRNKIGTVGFTEDSCGKVDISEIKSKTDVLSKDNNTHTTTCTNKVDELEENKESHTLNAESANTDNILQDCKENREKNEESKTKCAYDGNEESTSHDVISITNSNMVIEKSENNREAQQLQHSLILEEKKEDSNKDQNEQLIVEENAGVQLNENTPTGKCLQETTKIKVLSEVITEKICIVPTNISQIGIKSETETQSGIIVFQETNLRDELHEISSQQADSEKESSCFVELKENLLEQGETAETVIEEKVEVPTLVQLVSESLGTDSSLITTIPNNENITQDNTDTSGNKEINSVQKEEEVASQVSIQTDYETLDHSISNTENQAAVIHNIENLIDSSYSKDVEVSKSEVRDLPEPAENEMDVRPVEGEFPFVINNAVPEESSVEDQHIGIDNKSEINSDKLSQQNISVESTNNADVFEKTESIDSNNPCETSKEIILQHIKLPSESQNEDVITKMELDENCQNKEQSQQEILVTVNDSIELASEMNSETNFIIPTKTTVQSEDLVNTELNDVESQENEEIKVSSDNVISTDTNKVTEKLSQERFDDKDGKCDINQSDETGEVSLITVVPSKSVEESPSLVCNIDEAHGYKDNIEMIAKKSDTLSISDIELESSIKDAAPLINTLNKQDSPLHIETESETQMTTSQKNMINSSELETCGESKIQEKIIKDLPSPREICKIKDKEMSDLEQDDEGLMKNFTEEGKTFSETNINLTSTENENIESLNMNKHQESNSSRLLELAKSSHIGSSSTTHLEGPEVHKIQDMEFDMESKDMKQLTSEFPQETSQYNLEVVNQYVPSEKSDPHNLNALQKSSLDTSSESELIPSEKIDQHQTRDVQKVEMQQENIEHDQQENTISSQDQSSIIQDVVMEHVTSENDQKESTTSDQDQSNIIQEVVMEQVNIENVHQESSISDQDQSKVIQEVGVEPINIEHDQQESTTSDQDQSSIIQEIVKEHVNTKNDQQENTSDQDQSSIIQEVVMEQVNIENDHQKSTISDQDQSKALQEVGAEPINIENDQQEGTMSDQDQPSTIQEIVMEHVNSKNDQQESTSDQDQLSIIQEVVMMQINIENDHQKRTILDQDQSKVLQEVGVEQTNTENDQQESTVSDKDQSYDVQKVPQETSQENLIPENESLQSDEPYQDQLTDIQTDGMEQVNIKNDQQKSTTLDQDQSNILQEVGTEEVSIEHGQYQERIISDQDQSSDIQTVAMEQVNIENYQQESTTLDQDQSNNEHGEEDTISDQDQSSDKQTVGVEQVNIENYQQESIILDKDQSNIIHEVEMEQEHIEHGQCQEGITTDQDQSTDKETVEVEQVNIENNQQESAAILDQSQSNFLQEVVMEQVNIEHGHCQESIISDPDQSSDKQIVGVEQLNIEKVQQESTILDQDLSNVTHEVGMEQVNIERDQCQEGTISDQDQSTNKQTLGVEQENIENFQQKSIILDQDQSNVTQEVGMEQVNIERDQCQEVIISDQDQPSDKQIVGAEQVNIENVQQESIILDQDQSKVTHEVGREQENIEHDQCQDDIISEQDHSNVIQEVEMEHENIVHALCQEGTISDQDQSQDVHELTLKTSQTNLISKNESVVSDNEDQDQLNDIQEVRIYHVNAEHGQYQESAISETNQLEKFEHAILQQEANTCRSDILSAKALEKENMEEAQENIQRSTEQDKLSTDEKHLEVEQPVHTTFEEISTVGTIFATESNVQVNMAESQSVNKSKQMESQNQIYVEEVLDDVNKMNLKTDNFEDNADEDDQIEDKLIIRQESASEEHVSEEQNMEVIEEVASIHTELTERNEVAQDNYNKESYENVSKGENVIPEASLQSSPDEYIVNSDQNQSEQLNVIQDDAEPESQNLLQIHQELDIDKNLTETTNEISQNAQSPQVSDDINEASELQNAISHIMVSSETIDDMNVSILHDASITDIINSSPETDQAIPSELQSQNSEMFYSPDSTDMKTSEVENAISHIIEVSTIVQSLDTTSELQNAISHIIADPEPMIDCDKTSELQNAITHILDSPEIQKDSNDKMLHSDILPIEIDSIHSSSHEISVENDNVMLPQIDTTTHGDELKTEDAEMNVEETAPDDKDRKQEAAGIVQSIYTEPVVDLMLEDMDDQLKMFETKSEDSIANIPTIGEENVDTSKTFESQNIDLILPEETSLLNADDIISEITPTDQKIVEFPHEVDIKLQEQHVSENELKIDEMNSSETKDLNDVIAREIESLLELQTENLTDDTSTVDNESENQMNDFILEQKITNASVLESRSVSQNSSVDDKIVEVVLQDNVLHQSTQQEVDKAQQNIDFVEKDIPKNESKFGILIDKENEGEVSSSSIINTETPTNPESDSLITSTESTELQPIKELDTPLLIQVDTSITTVEETEPVSQSQTIEVPTSEYSSKMSENQDLKMTITKHKIESSTKVSESLEIDDSHSILKIYDPKDSTEVKKSQKPKEVVVPKLIIKPIVKTQSSPTPTVKHVEEVEQTVPKLFIKNMSPNRPGSPKVVKVQKSEITSPLKLTIKPVLKPEDNQSKSSPKLTIKPIIKTDEDTSTSGPKITIKPIVKPPEEESCHSPKITIKPIIKPDDCQSDVLHSPRITIKPIPKPEEVKEFCALDAQSPRITIKPVIKPEECDSPEKEIMLKKSSDVENTERSHSPRITIKPVVKHEEHKSSSKQDQKPKQDDAVKVDKKEGSPKITIKPIVKPADSESESVELIDFEEQIKQERIVLKINKNSMSKDSRKRDSTEEIEKLAKIKLKLSKEGGRAQIVSEQSKLKRALEESLDYDQKRTKFESDLTITPIDADAKKTEKVVDIIKDDVNITPIEPNTRSIFEDPLEKIPVFEITPESAVMMKSTTAAIVQQVTAPAPRKRGRPRKVPLVVREEFKDTKEEEVKQEQQEPAPEDTGRPKRSCRGPSVRTTLGIRTRKPRGSGRGRGRGRGARGVGSRGGRQQRVSAAKLKLLQEEAAAAIAEQSKSLDLEDGGDVEMKEEPPVENVTTETSEIALIEEETRMSADINTSRAQTPAKQIPTPGDVDDTQSSVQSTATTESAKGRKGTRNEVYHEPEGEIISADQLTEYYWGGGGPFMLQEQVAQFLGIKSFKRKYPGIQRRTVDMQERDFIRESGLASEAMCDLGLTAVHSADILDILYSDFQNKYEEYCKHQRDRQAKDFSNKQKALSLAASQEKNKHDIMQQAVQSAASWNANFNKSRREERKACMDLQTFTVHYPKGRFKMIEKNKVGHYPVALVPGQYTDYYKSFTSNELSNLPFNTMLDKPLNIPVDDDSQSDGSESDSDSSTSDSDSSSSDSSDEDCNLCSPASSSNQSKKVLAN